MNQSNRTPLYRITDWTVRYEVNRTRELKRLDWVPMPNRMDGDGYTELLNHKHGAAHFGAWNAIVQIASKCDPRGCLIRSCGTPHDAESLSRISRIPAKVFAEAMPRLAGIGWLEEVEQKPSGNEKLRTDSKVVTLEIPQEGATIPQGDAGIPQEGATLARARGVEGKGMEGNGAERKDMRINSQPEWKTDDTYQPFVEAYRKSGAAVIDEDFVKAHFDWRKLDFEQKAKALNGIAERIEKGAWDDPAIIPRAYNYLKGEYKRPVLARKQSGGNDLLSATKALIAERSRRETRP